MKKSHFLPACALAALTLATSAASAQVTDTTARNYPTVTPPTTTPPAVVSPTAQGSGDVDIARQLLAANQKEVAAAQAAITQAQSERVKEFAGRIQTDHSKAAEELQAWLQKNGAAASGMPSGIVDSPKANAETTEMKADTTEMKSDSAHAAHEAGEHAAKNAGEAAAKNAGEAAEDEASWSGKTGKEFDKAWVAAIEAEHKREIENLRENIIPRIQDDQLKALVQGMLPIMGNHLRDAEQLENELD